MQDRYDKLIMLKSELEEDIAKIKLQLDEAKTKFYLTGIISNSTWFNKAKYALEMKKLELRKVNVEFEQLKRTMRIQNKSENNIKTRTFERTFMNISKVILDQEEYCKILNLTHEAVNKIDKSKKEELKITRSIKWTKEDEEYLFENHKNATIEELAATLNRSENSVRSKLQTMKKKKMKGDLNGG